MTDDSFSIRTMTRADVEVAVDWAAGEGWNPGLHDAEAFYAADPSGYLIGEIDGRPVATISVVSYGDDFGFLGFYIVHPDFRGRGYGLKIWQAGMRQLEGKNVGLDGVVAQQNNYRKSGFVYAYGNQRYEGTGGGEGADGAVPISDVDFDAVLAYDTACFAAPRRAFLSSWLKQPESNGFAVVEGGALKGYGLIRSCRSGHKIGPLFAESAEIAERIYRALAATVPGDPLYLDVPLPNDAAVALAKRHRMTPVFETARMYTQGDPGVPLPRVFGVTTFELG